MQVQANHKKMAGLSLALLLICAQPHYKLNQWQSIQIDKKSKNQTKKIIGQSFRKTIWNTNFQPLLLKRNLIISIDCALR